MKADAQLYKEGEFLIKIKLSDESNLTTDYVLTIKIICSPEFDSESQNDERYFDKDAPIAYIDHIDMIGKVYIKFNSTMIPNLAMTEQDLESKLRLLEF